MAGLGPRSAIERAEIGNSRPTVVRAYALLDPQGDGVGAPGGGDNAIVKMRGPPMLLPSRDYFTRLVPTRVVQGKHPGRNVVAQKQPPHVGARQRPCPTYKGSL